MHSFGGDPARITLMGSSFGADLAALLLHSPMLGASAVRQAILCSALPSLRDREVRRTSQRIIEHLEVSYFIHIAFNLTSNPYSATGTRPDLSKKC